MSESTAKQKVLEALEKLPADASVEDAIERLVLLAKIERGLAELDAGKGVDHAEAKRRLLRYLKSVTSPSGEIIHGSYRIVYRLTRDLVEIVTVFHGARLFRLD